MLELARLGVATRPGYRRASGSTPCSRGSRGRNGSQFFEIEPRARLVVGDPRPIAPGEPIDGLVPPAVAAEIARLGLYRAGDRRTGGTLGSIRRC